MEEGAAGAEDLRHEVGAGGAGVVHEVQAEPVGDVLEPDGPGLPGGVGGVDRRRGVGAGGTGGPAAAQRQGEANRQEGAAPGGACHGVALVCGRPGVRPGLSPS